MFIRLRFPGFPGVLPPSFKEELVELRDGALGDVLDETVRLLHAWGRLPGLSGSIQGVKINTAPVSSGARIQGILLTQPGSTWISTQYLPLALSVHCEWTVPSRGLPPSSGHPLKKILETPITGPIRVSKSTLMDMLTLLEPSKVLPSVPFFQDEELSTRQLGKLREKCRVYFSSAYVEGFETGDTDYMKSVVRALRAHGIQATRLVEATHEAVQVWEGLEDQDALTLLDYKRTSDKESSFENAVVATLEYILEQKVREPNAVHVLHVQSRWPMSGNAFKGRLQRFRENGIKIVVTVHEYRYNERTPLDWVHNAVVLNDYCQPAHRVVFLNAEDLRKAVRDSERQEVTVPKKFTGHELVKAPSLPVHSPKLQAKARHVPVARTVDTTNLTQREDLKPVRILLFGMIRSGKGDKSAITLAKKIAQQKLDWRVVIAGSASDHKTLLNVLEHAFTTAIVKQAFKPTERDYTKLEDLKDRIALCMQLRAERYEQYLEKQREFNEQLSGREGELEQFNTTFGSRLNALRTAIEQFRLDPSNKRKQFPDKEELDNLNRTWGTLDKALKPPVWDCLPIDVFVNLSTPELVKVFNACKYAYKEDEKGMADNASSIVSCIANGCITFTSLGSLTPLDFQVPTGERFSFKKLKQDVFRETVFGLDESEVSLVSGDSTQQPIQALLHYRAKYHGAVVTPPKGEDATPEFVFNQISLREETPELNLQSYEAMRRAIETRFEPTRVAIQHGRVYLDLLD
jgi:hypothetical protein